MEEEMIPEDVIIITEDQPKDQIGNRTKDQIEEQKEDPTKDEDSIENQEEDQIMDMELAKEATQEHTIIPEASMIDIAKSVK